MKPDLSVIVLAGGDAKRFGGRKADRPLGSGRLMDRVLDVAHAVSDDVLLLGRDRGLEAPGVRRLPDESALRGPLAGLAAGLRAARNAWSLLLPCDMPHARTEVVSKLWSARGNLSSARAVTVHSGGMSQPFHALYHRDVLSEVLAVGHSSRPSLRSLLADLAAQGRLLDIHVESLGSHADGHFLEDVDTPADFARLLATTA
ncbi:MAG: NTP transferase domain-containing protein [Planctomycetota bacterium]|nr:NTP transferase domain-containing protein [Planctomycetota bacterium]